MIVKGAPVARARMILPSAWVGSGFCSPVRNRGSAPMGLKYRSAIARKSPADAASARICSTMALVVAYGLEGAIRPLSSIPSPVSPA
ncbi:Uncharacterised protein [Mycobacterium tuberculosis]|nr:Uncharacterised protein [Mycobacterium tuberculosis]